MSSPANGPSWTVVAHDPGVLYHYHPPAASFNTLPVELIVFIFSISQADGWAGLALTALQLVCREWRRLIINNRMFWTRVNITLRYLHQIHQFKSSLRHRLKHRWPKGPLHIQVTLFGFWEHEKECGCEGPDYEGQTCQWQTVLFGNLRELLRILVGPRGRYMARWASFLFDLSQWSDSGGFSGEDIFGFGKTFDYPSPLLKKVQLWSVRAFSTFFPNASSLSAVRLRECFLTEPMNLNGVPRVWIDCCHLDGFLVSFARWADLADVEELTLRVWEGDDLSDGGLLNLAFKRIRKLCLLGHVPRRILDAVGDCQLEQLILRVNSPADLLSVIKSPIVLRNVDEIVLGGFRNTESDAGSAARQSALRDLFNSANPIGIAQVTLLDIDTGKELLAAGINIDGARYWSESRNAGEIGVIEPWKEDEWECGPDPKYLNPESDEGGIGDQEGNDDESEDEETGDEESNDEGSEDAEMDEDNDGTRTRKSWMGRVQPLNNDTKTSSAQSFSLTITPFYNYNLLVCICATTIPL